MKTTHITRKKDKEANSSHYGGIIILSILMTGILMLLFAAPAFAVETEKAKETDAAEESDFSFWLDAETGAAFTGYNDVQIPAEDTDDPGTKFSLADDLDPDPVWFYRLRGGIEWRTHSLFALYAPLTVESTGSIDEKIEFKGETFPAGTELIGTFKFNSYRLGYSYAFADLPHFLFAAGLTGKIRDAYIRLEEKSSGSIGAKRSNLGVVPLIHLKLRWDFAPPFSLLLEGDGLAAPQGRAEDFLLAFLYSPDEKTDIRIGYRLLEGGSDGGGDVYTFSMFHYLGVGIQRRF